jgi:fibronectin-binding autotransporter adhesin
MRIVFIFLGIISSSVFAINATWNLDASGNWNVNGNWTPATFPNAIDDTANFGNVITANRVISLGAGAQNITLGTMNFDSANNYTIQSGLADNRLIFDVSAGNANLILTSLNGAGSHSITCPITLNDTLSMSHSSTANFTISGAISGTGGLIKTGTGSGSLILSGTTANTYTGLTTINAGTLLLNKTAGVNAIAGNALVNTGGTLSLGAANQINNTSILTLSGGTFNMNGNTETIGSLVFNSGTLTQGGATLSLANATPTALTMGDGALISGNIAFTAAGGVTGNTTTTRSTINGNVALGTFAHAFNIANGADSIDMDISGQISGTGSVTKSTGTGILQYSGSTANTYTGLTTINAGELRLNKTSGVNALAGSATINTGGTLSLAASDQIANTAVVTISGGTFNLGGFTDTISQLVVNNNGVVQGGTLSLGNNTTALTLGNGALITANINLISAGAVNYNGNATTATISGNLDLGSSPHSMSIANGTASSDLVISGIISGTGALTILSPSTLSRLELAGTSSNTNTGLVTISRGNLFLNKTSGNAIAGDIRINDNDGSVTLGGPDQIADTSTFTHSSGTFNMSGFNETIGTYTFSSGTLNQGGATLSLASATTALTMRNTTINGNIAILNGGSVIFNAASGGTATINGNIDLGSTTVFFNIADGPLATDMLISGTISSTGAGITKGGGAGVLVFSGVSPNTYTGLTTINTGELHLSKTSGVNALSGTATINAAGTLSLGASEQIIDTADVNLSGGTFNLAGFDETISRLTFNSGVFNQGGGILFLASPTTALSMRNTTINGDIAILNGGSVNFNAGNGGTATINGNIDLGSTSTFFNIADGPLATDMLISGTISSTGAGLIKSDTGVLVFSGASPNTYTGLTTVSNGELLLNKTPGINAIAGDALIDGGILSLGAANQISDTSTVTLSSGTFNLAGFGDTFGTFNYQGGTFNQGGAILSLASTGTALSMRDTTISGDIAILNGGAVVFDNANNGTATINGDVTLGATSIFNIADGTALIDMLINGSITNGGIIKTGEGNLVLTNVNTVGTTAVNNGTLTVNGTLGGGGAMTVAPGGRLAGTGTVIKDVTFSGTLAPGDNNIGTITLVGNQVFASGSTLEINFNSSNRDLVDIIGSLSIEPGSTLRLLPEFDIYPDNFSYTILQATAGIFGRFSTVTSLPLFQTEVVYSGLNIALVRITLLPFSALIKQGNAAAVAHCLDALPSTVGDLAFVKANLRMLPTLDQIQEALLQLQPSALTSLAVVQENNTLNIRNAIYNHLEKPFHSLNRSNGITVWISPLGAKTNQYRQEQEPGFSADSQGILAGLDFQLKEGSFFGIGLGHDHTDLDWTQSRGYADIDSTYFESYGRWSNSYGYLLGSLIGGYNNYSTSRPMTFFTLNRLAKGRHDGLEGSINLKGALTLGYSRLIFSPFISIDYIYLHESAFKEKGAQSLNLQVKGKNSNLLSNEIGMQLSPRFKSSVIPFIQFSAIRESRFKGKYERASLQDGCSLAVIGLNPSRTLGGIAAGIDTKISNNFLSLFYQGRYSNNFKNHSLYLQYQYQWS